MGYYSRSGISNRFINIHQRLSFPQHSINKFMGYKGMGSVMAAVVPKTLWEKIGVPPHRLFVFVSCSLFKLKAGIVPSKFFRGIDFNFSQPVGVFSIKTHFCTMPFSSSVPINAPFQQMETLLLFPLLV